MLSKSLQILNFLHLPETGKERDRESGLDYYPARYRDADVGYWMSPDAARQFPNLYGNNLLIIYSGPVSTNPFGHIAIAGEGVYSFGTGTQRGASLNSYLSHPAISRRSNTLINIKTTPEQDKAALTFLKTQPEIGPWYTGSETCSDRVAGALQSALPQQTTAYIEKNTSRPPGLLPGPISRPDFSFPRETRNMSIQIASETGGSTQDLNPGQTASKGLNDEYSMHN